MGHCSFASRHAAITDSTLRSHMLVREPGTAINWEGFKSILASERLPAALVDLDALERNVARTARRFSGTGKTMRVASKSVRHTGLLRRILDVGGPSFVGVMCFTAEEAAWLADEGFDDLFVAYPTVQPAALDALGRRAAAGTTVAIVVDCDEHIDALARAGRQHQSELGAVIEIDMSYRPANGRMHLGVRRSPIRDASAAVALARRIRQTAGVHLRGVMGYEAHIAGLQDANPFAKVMNPVKRALKRVSTPDVQRRRAAVVAALREDGHTVELVNGGGTGSVHATSTEDVITEVTAGSGFVCSHLFDYFRDFDLEAAAFFALEASRRSDDGFITCAGGGYVASGEPGWDRLPIPWEPRGLRYVSVEGAGEVQTPLLCGVDTPAIAIGDPVVFRHAKAGELAERFEEYLLVRGGTVVAREPTYRGRGKAFL